jgi:hypothetical protein
LSFSFYIPDPKNKKRPFEIYDPITILIHLCMVFFNCFLPLLVLPSIYARMDPFYYVFAPILPDYALIHLLFVLLRTLLSFMAIFLAVRHLNTVLVTGFVFLLRVQACLDSFVSKSIDPFFHPNIPAWHWIKCIQSVFQYRVHYNFFAFYAQEFLSNISTASMAVALAEGIILNFSSLRMSHLLPVPVAVVFVTLSLAIPVLSAVCFPFVPGVLESSDKVRRQWMLQATSFPPVKRRLFLREIRSLIPCTIKMSVGKYNFRILDHSVNIAYFRRYVEYTINACLSIPL